MIEFIKQIIKRIFCKHKEYECSEIHNGTFNEVNSWCKNCGKIKSYD